MPELIIFSVLLSKPLAIFFNLGSLHYLALTPFVFYTFVVVPYGRAELLWLVVVSTIVILTILATVGSYSLGFSQPVLSVIVQVKLLYLLFALRNTRIGDLGKPITLIAILQAMGLIAFYIFPEIYSELKPEMFAGKWSRTTGFQLNANFTAYLSAVLALYYLFIKNNRLIAFFFFLTIILTGSRLGLAMFVLAAVYISGVANVRAIVSFGLPTIVLSMLLLLGFGQERLLQTIVTIQGAVNGTSNYPRIAMLIGGWRLAVDNFPFGAGGGTYASSLGADPSVYAAAGVGFVLHDDLISGIFDSGVGAILGQFGFFGLSLIYISIFICIRLFSRSRLTNTDAFFLVALIFSSSFFLTVVSDFYTSLCFVLIAMILKDVRANVTMQEPSFGVKKRL